MQHFATLSSASALTRCLVATGSRPSRRRRDRSSSRIQSEPRGLPAETRPRSTPRSQDIKIVQNSRKLGSVLIIWKSASRFDHLALERVDSINIKMLCGFSVRLISGLGPSTSRSSPWTPHRSEWDSARFDRVIECICRPTAPPRRSANKEWCGPGESQQNPRPARVQLADLNCVKRELAGEISGSCDANFPISFSSASAATMTSIVILSLPNST